MDVKYVIYGIVAIALIGGVIAIAVIKNNREKAAKSFDAAYKKGKPSKTDWVGWLSIALALGGVIVVIWLIAAWLLQKRYDKANPDVPPTS